MKCIKNNEAKVRRSADVYAIEKAIAELSVLIRQGKAGVVNIQRAVASELSFRGEDIRSDYRHKRN